MDFEELTLQTLESFLKNNEFEYSPTQRKICFPIVRRIYKKMKLGIAFHGMKVSETLIIDGHHRYIASLLSQFPLSKFASPSTSSTTIFQWSEILIDKEESDTQAKIAFLNEQDAAFNNIDIAVFQELS